MVFLVNKIIRASSLSDFLFGECSNLSVEYSPAFLVSHQQIQLKSYKLSKTQPLKQGTLKGNKTWFIGSSLALSLVSITAPINEASGRPCCSYLIRELRALLESEMSVVWFLHSCHKPQFMSSYALLVLGHKIDELLICHQLFQITNIFRYFKSLGLNENRLVDIHTEF